MHHYLCLSVESWVAEQLRPQSLDLEVQGPSLAHRVVYLDKELYSTLSLFTQVYKWVPATYCWGGGVTLRGTSNLIQYLFRGIRALSPQPGGVQQYSYTVGMLHAKETGIGSGCFGLWLVCPLPFTNLILVKLFDFHCLY